MIGDVELLYTDVAGCQTTASGCREPLAEHTSSQETVIEHAWWMECSELALWFCDWVIGSSHAQVLRCSSAAAIAAIDRFGTGKALRMCYADQQRFKSNKRFATQTSCPDSDVLALIRAVQTAPQERSAARGAQRRGNSGTSTRTNGTRPFGLSKHTEPLQPREMNVLNIMSDACARTFGSGKSVRAVREAPAVFSAHLFRLRCSILHARVPSRSSLPDG